jgi:hypothetical protein
LLTKLLPIQAFSFLYYYYYYYYYYYSLKFDKRVYRRQVSESMDNARPLKIMVLSQCAGKMRFLSSQAEDWLYPDGGHTPNINATSHRKWPLTSQPSKSDFSTLPWTVVTSGLSP